MYRDLVSKPEEIECNELKWWIQVFRKADGNLVAVNLYDEDGDFVGEFTSMTDLEFFISGVQK